MEGNFALLLGRSLADVGVQLKKLIADSCMQLVVPNAFAP
jgi:hypothetical protein